MGEYTCILAATDFSEGARRAVRRAAVLARCWEARLCLLHVVEHFPENLPIDPIPPENKDPKAYLLHWAQERLRDLAGGGGLQRAEVVAVAVPTSARQEILRQARQRRADLVVLGATGREERLMMGSTAAGWCRAPTATCWWCAPRGLARNPPARKKRGTRPWRALRGEPVSPAAAPGRGTPPSLPARFQPPLRRLA